MTATGTTGVSNSSCPRCGAGFRCGMVGNDAECWCVKLPHVMPVPIDNPVTGSDAAKASCFCPACLQQITDEQQHNTPPASD